LVWVVVAGPGRVEGLGAGPALSRKLLLALIERFGVLGGNPGGVYIRLRLLHLRPGQIESGARIGIVEPGDYLICFDMLAFLDQGLHNPVGDFRRYSRLAPGDDIA
jgi:hypothetical protein